MQQIELRALQDGCSRRGSTNSERSDPETIYFRGTLPTAKAVSSTAGDEYSPTDEELKTLPRVADRISWSVYTVAFVELCERFSYYGTQILFQNFVQRKRLTPTGAALNPSGDSNNNPGALGRGQQTATALSTFFAFWCYVTPLLGAWLADTYFGRYKMIMISIVCALAGHFILVAGATPSSLQHPDSALAKFIVGIIVFGLGTGGFKPNISPLIAEQIVVDGKLRIETDSKGERVIVDPAQTSARVYNWFYLFINIGALLGQLSMSYAALYIGYYLAFLLPTILFLLCPLVLIVFKKTYRLNPPQGSVLGPALHFIFYATRGRWSPNPVRTIRNLRTHDVWNAARPSRIPAGRRPHWMTFDDAWVAELRRGVQACTVFLWMPVYWLTYNQLQNNLISQADTMRHTGVPPEIVSNFDPLALIILIPLCDLLVYPALRKSGWVRVTPIRKITLGFWFGSAAMIYAAFLQRYIYTHNECGMYPNEGLPSNNNRAGGGPGAAAGVEDCAPADVSIWWQTPIYVLIATSEILASVTVLEYAFTKAPRNMRSMVQAFGLCMTAAANIIGEALIWLARDPLLVWNYALMGVVAAVAGGLVWKVHGHLDDVEDAMNLLPEGHVGVETTRGASVDLRQRRESMDEEGSDGSEAEEEDQLMQNVRI